MFNSKLVRLALVACGLIAGTGAIADAAEDVGVYVDNPGIARYIETAQGLRQQLPGARARWNEIEATGATFTIRFYRDRAGDQPQPCEGVPINVQVRRGHLNSATYAASTANCKAGTPVNAADDPALHSLLSPTALFQEVSSQIDRGVSGQACIEGNFDDEFGLPTMIHEGCPWVKESDVRIQISDIVSLRQRFWNLAITSTGVVLCLLALAFSHYKRVQRRQEKMPELLLR